MQSERKLMVSKLRTMKQTSSLILAVILTLALLLLGRTELAIGLVKAPYDLLLHAGFFGFIALLIWYGSVYKTRLTIVLVSTLTIADELYQLSMPGRHASVKDVLAGILGTLIILLIMFILKMSWKKGYLKF